MPPYPPIELDQSLVPANPEAEQAVLGSILIDRDALALVSGWLAPADFYQEKNAWIYQAILDMDQRRTPADFLTLTDELDQRRQLDEVGGPAYIMDLLNAVPTAIHVEHYARIVENASVRRKLIRVAGQIAQMAFNPDVTVDGHEMVQQAESLVYGIGNRRAGAGPKRIGLTMPDVIDEIEATARGEMVGVQTGIGVLDDILKRIRGGDLCLLAARPGKGKTALALNIAYNVAKATARGVGIFSLEMDKSSLQQRLLSRVGGVDSQLIRMGELGEMEWHRIMEAAGELSTLPIFLDDEPAIGMNYLRSEARRLVAREDIVLLVIDYLQLMTGDGARRESREKEVAAIATGLKNLARELDIPILALCQLSRAVEQRADKRPVLSDLRESGSLEQDADVVVFLYSNDEAEDDISLRSVTHADVAKHRGGPTGSVALYFNKPHQCFTELRLRNMERVPLQGEGSHASYIAGVMD